MDNHLFDDDLETFEDEFVAMRRRMLTMMALAREEALARGPEASLREMRTVEDDLVDIIEEDRAVRVVLPLPGAAWEDIRVRVHPRTLEVSCPKRSFLKVVRMPCEVRARGCEAACKNGVLEIVVPRHARQRLSRLAVA
jgi:HSP20 family molecular chaperone IbpA